MKLYIGQSNLYIGQPNESAAGRQHNSLARLKQGRPVAFQEGDSRYVGYHFSGDYHQERVIIVLERSNQDKLAPPAGLSVQQTISIAPSWSAEQLRTFIESVQRVNDSVKRFWKKTICGTMRDKLAEAEQ